MTISFSEFLEQCFNLDVNLYTKDAECSLWKQSTINQDDVFLAVKWISGGNTGNSCWGRDNRSVAPETPEDIETPIAKVFSAFEKDISFVEYYKKVKPLIDTFNKSDESDYYGNYYDYSGFQIKLIDLYNIIFDSE